MSTAPLAHAIAVLLRGARDADRCAESAEAKASGLSRTGYAEGYGARAREHREHADQCRRAAARLGKP